MPYTSSSDPFSGAGVTRDSVAQVAALLTAAMVSDSTDLAPYPKALRVYNGTAADLTLMVTPQRATDDSSAGAVPLIIPAGAVAYEALAIRRIWATGSTGLLNAGAIAIGVSVLLLQG